MLVDTVGDFKRRVHKLLEMANIKIGSVLRRHFRRDRSESHAHAAQRTTHNPLQCEELLEILTGHAENVCSAPTRYLIFAISNNL